MLFPALRKGVGLLDKNASQIGVQLMKSPFAIC